MVRLRADDLAWQETGDEIVCLDLLTSRYLSVNGVGSALWTLLLEDVDRETLEQHLRTTYGVDAERARADVEQFLADLDARGLLADR